MPSACAPTVPSSTSIGAAPPPPPPPPAAAAAAPPAPAAAPPLSSESSRSLYSLIDIGSACRSAACVRCLKRSNSGMSQNSLSARPAATTNTCCSGATCAKSWKPVSSACRSASLVENIRLPVRLHLRNMAILADSQSPE